MKRLFLVIALALAVNASAQDLTPIKFVTPTFYNESGTAVAKIASGDTLVTQAFNLMEYDVISFSLATEGSGDSAHLGLHTMLGDGKGVGNGFYVTGYETMSSRLDSIASDGLRNGAKTGCGTTVERNRLNTTTHQKYERTIGAAAIGVTDSVVTRVYDATDQNMWVKFVLVGEINDNQEVSNSDWLNNSRVVLRRKDN